jgi:xanthine/uracil permease
MTIGILSLAWMMAMATLGLALAANGLGLHILARKYQVAGLASLRLGLMRLAAVVLAAAFATPAAFHAHVDGAVILAGLAIGCGLLLALGLWAVLKKAANQTVIEVPAPPVRTRKRKVADLPGGEPA